MTDCDEYQVEVVEVPSNHATCPNVLPVLWDGKLAHPHGDQIAALLVHLDASGDYSPYSRGSLFQRMHRRHV